MLGVYDYTVILTYLSVISASFGIISSFTNETPLVSACCLILCGILDVFDGKVARAKKNRSTYEKKFGIQIDSLSDIIAFGILPACIGINLVLTSEKFSTLPYICIILSYIVNILYILCGLIRLAHYNVTEDDRQQTEEGNRKYFTGVPITSAVFVFPLITLLQLAFSIDLSIIYTLFIVLTAFLFISELKIKKLELKQICISIVIGLILASVLILLFIKKS